VPKGGLEIRPAMDRMRESVFAVLGDLTGLSFLDLFAGSGIIASSGEPRSLAPGLRREGSLEIPPPAPQRSNRLRAH